MAIDGTAIRPQKYIDSATGQIIEVDLTVRDHMFFKLLQELTAAIKRRDG